MSNETTDDCIAEGHDLGPGNCCDTDCPWSQPVAPIEGEPPTAPPLVDTTRADAVQALVDAAERIGDELSRGGIEAASVAALDAAAARVREVWGTKPAPAAVVEGRVPCVVCDGDIVFNNCPTGGWWSHCEHPADDHEADPPRNLPQALGGDTEAAPPVDLSALRAAVERWDATANPFASEREPLTNDELAALLGVMRVARALVDATPAEPVAAISAQEPAEPVRCGAVPPDNIAARGSTWCGLAANHAGMHRAVDGGLSWTWESDEEGGRHG